MILKLREETKFTWEKELYVIVFMEFFAKSFGIELTDDPTEVIGSIFGFLLIACVVLFLLNKKGIINIPFLNKKRKKDESNN